MKVGKCPKCKKWRMLTKHSVSGHHMPPFVPRCRDCHDKEHGMGKRKIGKESPGKYQKGTPMWKQKKK